MSAWRTMDSAPRDGSNILILTADRYVMQGYWDPSEVDFYKSKEGWASYDPDNAQGAWVSLFVEGDDKRMYCGEHPEYWRPIPKLPKRREW